MSSSRRLDMAAPEIVVRWIAVLVGAALTVLVTRNGLVVSPDSTFYLSAAESLADGDGLRTPTGEPLVLYPPGTAVVYAVGELLPLDALTWVRILNTVLAAGAIYATSVVVSRHVRSTAVAVSATIFTALSVGLLAVTRAAWSEPIFLVLGVLFVASLARAAVETPPSLRWSFAVAVIVWASFFTRYAGLVLIPVGAIALIWIAPVRSVRRSVEFVAMSSVVPLLWLASNRLRHGSAAGDRPPSIDSLPDVVQEIAIVIGSWIVPAELLMNGGWLRAGLGIVVGVVLIAAAIGGIRRVRVAGERAGFEHVGSDDVDDRTVVASVAALTALAAVSMVALTQMRTAIDLADARLLSPALLPAIIAIAVYVDVRRPTSAGRRTVATYVGIGAVVGVVAVQAAAAFVVVRDGEPQRWTFTHPTWTRSEVMAALEGVDDDVTIWTNNPSAVWASTDHRRIAETPRSGEYRSDVTRPFPPLDELAPSCGPTLLVWFERSGTFHFPVERIGEAVTLSDSRVLSDGEIHRVESVPRCR